MAPLFTRPFVAVCVLAVGVFSAFQVLTPVLPQYVVAIGGGNTEVGLVMGSFSLASVFARPWVGRALDVTGARRLPIRAAVGVFVVAPLGYLALQSVWALIPVRIAHGLGLATFYTATSTLATDVIPESRRTEGLSYFSMSVYLALAAGPALGESLLGPGRRHELADFRPPFLAATALAVVALALTAMLSRDPPRRGGSLRGGVPLLRTQALAPTVVLALAAVGFAALVAFVVLYARSLGAERTELVFVTLAATVVVVRLVVGRVGDRVGPHRLIPASALVCAAAMVVFAGARSIGWLLVGAAVFGVGFGALFPLLMAHVVNRAPPEGRGSALGLLTAALDIGIGGGSAVLGALGDALGGGTRGYRGMYVAGAVAAVASAVVFVITQRGSRRSPGSSGSARSPSDDPRPAPRT
jgi:MFS family permease